MARSEMTGH